jgi:hypothetical protein
MNFLSSLYPSIEIRTLHLLLLPGTGNSAAADRRSRRAELPAAPRGCAGSLNPNIEIQTLYFLLLPGAGDSAAADRRPRRAELPASPPGRAGWPRSNS